MESVETMIDEATGRDPEDVVTEFFSKRKVVVVSSRVSAVAWLRDLFTARGLAAPFLVLADATGLSAEADFHEVEVKADSVDTWLGALESRIVSPPAELLAALDAYDPAREAIVLTPPFRQGRPTLLGRRCFGFRRAEWARYEDKTVSDSFWARAGVPHLQSVVTELSENNLRAAFEECDEGAGVVVSADATQVMHSGSRGVVRVSSADEIPRAHDFLAGRCAKVRVAPFVEGISCSTHGMVFDHDVAVFRPIEQVVLRQGQFFPLMGGSSFWTPPAEVTERIRAFTAQVGHRLRSEADYRGGFHIDGIISARGFMPIEVNARMGPYINGIAVGAGIPLELINNMVMEGEPVDIDMRDFERRVIGALDSAPVVRVAMSLEGTKGAAPGTAAALSLRAEDSRYVACAAGDEWDVKASCATTPVGASIVLEFPDRPDHRGVLLAPRAARAIKAATRIWGMPAPDYTYATPAGVNGGEEV
ncbi:hypothetical protein ACWC0C_45305 [Streptomyces sp. NPDC001709]